jgi:hypothetical protein
VALPAHGVDVIFSKYPSKVPGLSGSDLAEGICRMVLHHQIFSPTNCWLLPDKLARGLIDLKTSGFFSLSN